MTAADAQAHSDPRRLPSWRRLAAITSSLVLLEVAATLLNNNSWNAGGVTILWPSNGFLVGVLLCSGKRQWPAFFTVGFLVDLALNIYLGHNASLWTSAYLSSCNMLEVLLAAAPLYAIIHPHPDLTRRRQLFSLLFYGVLIAPAIAAFLASFVLELHNPRLSPLPRLHSFQWWFTADALGIATVTPLYLSVSQPHPFLDRSLAEVLGLFTLLIATSSYVFWQIQLPLLFVVLLCLLLLGVRTGLAGSALGLLIIAIIGGFLTTSSHGPVSLMPSHSISERDLLFQSFIAISMLALYLVEVVMAENKRLGQSVLANEARFRLLAEASRDIIALTDFEGRPHYVSPAVTEMLGWQPRECFGGDADQAVHPEDRAAISRRLADARVGSTPGAIEFRCLHKQGHYVWVEANERVYVEPDSGEPSGLVIAVRDISSRKAAEEKLNQAFRMVENLATIDGLTGIANRRRFDEVLKHEWRRALRESTWLSLLLMDVDHFKLYNDLYGHLHGDDCLRRVADTVRAAVSRPGDLLARYGGEEFAVILASTDRHGALEVATEIRIAVENCSMTHTGSPHGVATLSIGCSSCVPNRNSDLTELLRAADQALYRAKNNGRNRIEVSDSLLSED